MLWVVWLTVAGFSFVASNDCDSTDAWGCYEDLVNYESIMFPLYGSNEAKLQDTCGTINSSVSCIGTYNETCYGSENCDENCVKLLKFIDSFFRLTGLTSIYENLCERGNPLRQTYLDNAECLEQTADLYAACHNMSQESLDYIRNAPGANTVENNCCYKAWYRECFTDATKRNCGENATFVVSVTVHYVLGKTAQELCSSEPDFCAKPPLPTDESMIDNEIDSNEPIDNELDKDKDGKIDKAHNNTIDNSKGAATTLYASSLLVLPYVFSILYKYTL